MMQHELRLRLVVLTLPAVLVMILYEVFLGHRHDYTGHFVAGYGASIGVMTFASLCLHGEGLPRLNPWIAVVLSVVCIALGAIAEATAFRIAKFDEIDFCNQSLGAALAGMCAFADERDARPPANSFPTGLAIGILFVTIGACFAVA